MEDLKIDKLNKIAKWNSDQEIVNKINELVDKHNKLLVEVQKLQVPIMKVNDISSSPVYGPTQKQEIDFSSLDLKKPEIVEQKYYCDAFPHIPISCCYQDGKTGQCNKKEDCTRKHISNE